MKRLMIWTTVVGGGVLAAAMVIVAPAGAQNGGEAVYKAKCVGCHGPDGKGSTPAGKAMGARDFGSADVQKETDEQLAEIIAKGKGKMPAFKTLTADQVKELVAYVRSLGKKK
ncbi:MAG TPA: c-type cytochrome [Candidatus Acidoferrum sp.]|nr:c-type cytochrome [Candidatus Acidoferrum sp.]